MLLCALLAAPALAQVASEVELTRAGVRTEDKLDAIVNYELADSIPLTR
jgi:hypothetical protein